MVDNSGHFVERPVGDHNLVFTQFYQNVPLHKADQTVKPNC